MKRARDIVERIRCAILGESFDLKMLQDAADEIARLRLTDALTVRWIPVTERLPEPWVSVLVAVYEYVLVGRVDTDGVWRDCRDETQRGVTHWMSLPASPALPTDAK